MARKSKEPAVISGHRGAKDSPRSKARKAAAKALHDPESETDEQSLLLPSDETMKRVEDGAPTRAGKKYRFRSRYEKHYLLLKAIPSTKSFDGRTVPGETVASLFKDYNYETDDPGRAALMKEHDTFGVTFWDADAQDQEVAIAEYEGFLSRISKSPMLRERLKKDLSKKDFSVLEALTRPDPETEGGQEQAG